MDTTLELEKECGLCYGSGNASGVIGGCPSCKGVGMRITVEGNTVLEFVMRWLDVQPRELVRLGISARIAQGRDEAPNPLLQ